MMLEHSIEMTPDTFASLCLRQLRLGNISLWSNNFLRREVLRIHIAGDDAFNIWITHAGVEGERYFLQKIGMQGPKALTLEDHKILGVNPPTHTQEG